MPNQDMLAVIRSATADLRLLDHPYYRRWTEGRLRLCDLAIYAGQYRHFEAALPDWLGSAAARVSDPAAGALMARNLSDELGGSTDGSEGETHQALFEAFAAGVGAEPAAAPSPMTAALVATYEAAASAGPGQFSAALSAYECQATEVAISKAAGLRQHYGLDGEAVAFWDTHAAIEASHARWSAEVTRRLCPPEAVYDAARAGASAWWAFLSEREEALV